MSDPETTLLTDLLTALQAWREVPAAVDPQRVADAQDIAYGYGTYCAQRADEAMRRKFERLARGEA
jgi:hypothetical protein